ncbi:hypothetical protein E4U58_004251 [Claviceps cyperi]|nr:hypothetical protein E4U58_004251 [Claviceps cyperi]
MQLTVGFVLLALRSVHASGTCDTAGPAKVLSSTPSNSVGSGSDSSCPEIHIIGARGTGIPPGYDLLLPLVNTLKAKYSGSTSEYLDYPACGGAAACGGLSYGDSARAGTKAIAQAVSSFNSKCPNTKFVLMGYSQGGHVIDNALCGGEDPNARITDTTAPIPSNVAEKIVAATFMGNPRYQVGLPYDVGTCKASGFDARPQGFTCTYADKIQSYCDNGDPYCCKGQDAATHGAYVTRYGDKALQFIESKLNGGA